MDDQTWLAIRNTMVIGGALVALVTWLLRKWRA
jgi:hypothetical protein